MAERLYGKKILHLPLRLPALLYRLAVGIRNLLFDARLLGVAHFPVPVISIGNITAGGTGKTPFTIWLAQSLQPHFRKIAIVSRGYGRHSRGLQLVSDGAGRIAEASTGGDEPVMIARRLSGVPVLVAEKRREGLAEVVRRFSPGLIILDDGFQHRHVHRDCDIVLVDCREDMEAGMLLPAGRMREPLKNLKRADVMVYMHTLSPPGETLNHPLIRYFKGPVCYASHRAGCFVAADLEPVAKADQLEDVPVAAFAGIARPEGFRTMLQSLGLQLIKFTALPDHHTYDTEWMKNFIVEGRQSGCRYFITTEKDMVKLPGALFNPGELLALRLDVVVDEPEKVLQTIREHIDKSRIGA